MIFHIKSYFNVFCFCLGNNSLNDLGKYELKEIEGDEEELGTLATDITKLKWKPLEDSKSGSVGSVSMIETNTILKDIHEVGLACQKSLEDIVKIFKTAQKKKGD